MEFKHFKCIVVFNKTKDSILFCKRKKDPYKGLYNFVGGKVEPGESSEKAAYRELQEETGISPKDIDLYRVMNRFSSLRSFRISFIMQPMGIQIYSNHGTIPLDYTVVPKLIDGAHKY